MADCGCVTWLHWVHMLLQVSVTRPLSCGSCRLFHRICSSRPHAGKLCLAGQRPGLQQHMSSVCMEQDAHCATASRHCCPGITLLLRQRTELRSSCFHADKLCQAGLQLLEQRLPGFQAGFCCRPRCWIIPGRRLMRSAIKAHRLYTLGHYCRGHVQSH